MAVLNVVGFETQGATESLVATSPSVSWSTAIKRSGSASLRVNAAATTGFMTIGAYSPTTAVYGEIGRTAQTFCTFYMYFTTLPGATMGTVRFRNAAGSEIVRINVGTGGAITLVGTATSATIATISTGQWYRMEMRVTSNGTCGLSVDGGTEVTVTGNNFTFDRIIMGPSSGATSDMYFDDLVIDDATFHVDPQVTIGKAIGSGTYSAWTDGTGSTFAEVDEVPPNVADYIQNTSGTNVAHTFDMTSAATIGFSNTITAVVPFLIAAESVSATTSISVRLRSGGTDYDSTAADVGNTTPVAKAWIKELDPATGAAWTSTNFDAIEVGVLKAADASTVRVHEVYVMVLTTVVVVPAMLTLSSAPGAATATMTLASPTTLTLGASAGVATAALAVRSPALLSMTASGLSNATAALSAATYLILGGAGGLSAATLSVRSPALLSMLADGVATAAATVITASGIMVLSASAGISSASVVVASPVFVVLGATDGLSSAALALRSPALLSMTAAGVASAIAVVSAPGIAYIVLQADGLSSASGAITTPVSLSITAAGLSTAVATVSTIGYLVPATIAGVATATLAVKSPALLALSTVANVATATLVVFSPANVIVGAVAGLSNATITVKSPALLQLSADGLSNATLAVKSPALLSLTASGLSNASALVSSKTLLVIHADGTSLATITELSLGPSTKVRIGGAILLRPVLIQGGTQRVVHIGAGYTNPVRIPGGF